MTTDDLPRPSSDTEGREPLASAATDDLPDRETAPFTPGPEVSVIIPVHNEGPIIEGSIRELRARFEKIGRSFEIIIAENGSTDDTVQIAEELCEQFSNIRLMRSPEPNYGAALRAGIEAAQGR
ncbi:MAG: glycosyltransferase, partial [Myxococcota bacterium]